MKNFRSTPRFFSLLTSLLGAAALIASSAANAHTVQICWKDVGSVTTFYAGTYHSISSPVGSIIIDGFDYPFSGLTAPASLPSDAHCWTAPSYNGGLPGNPDGVPKAGVYTFQTFTSSFPAGQHTLSFTTSTAVEWPWEYFPPQTFGGGACADADFDGLCNDVDACPLDAANDGDNDGVCGNIDNCPLDYNPLQTDANNNSQGDICEGVVCGNGLVQGSEQCDDGNTAGGDGCSAICTLEATDTPPNANAGADQNVNEGLLVTLDGGLSNDPDGDALTYVWTQVGGTAVVLSDVTSDQPTFIAPFVAPGGETLSFQLTVTANGQSSTDSVNIVVSNVNHTPVAVAGIDQSVAEGAPVVLDGTDSFDIDNDPFTYTWVQESGPAVAISDANTAKPSFTAPLVGSNGAPGIVATIVFKLTVDDGLPQDAPASGYTLANVEDKVSIDITNVNNDPAADAGLDLTLNENSAVQLNANGSTDPDGDMLTFSWSQIDGPEVGVITDALTATPSFTAPFVNVGGADLTFEVMVDDGYGGVATDQVVVHVQNANDPPLVSAAQPTSTCLWPPNHNLVTIGITGVSDPEDNATITVDSITQDEPTNGLGDGDTAIDAIINADGTALLRAERSGKGDGRMYHIHFTASDLEGSASGVVNVCVQHNKKSNAIDGGELFDSTK